MRSSDLERLFADHADALYGFLSYRVGDRALAEDLLGDTFERVVRSHDSYNANKGSERTWLYTIALNCLRDRHRRSEAEERALQRAGEPAAGAQEQALASVRDRDELHRAMATLDVAERELIALRYGADLRLQDVAAVTGLPETTVQWRLYSGLRKLRGALDADQAPPPRARAR